MWFSFISFSSSAELFFVPLFVSRRRKSFAFDNVKFQIQFQFSSTKTTHIPPLVQFIVSTHLSRLTLINSGAAAERYPANPVQRWNELLTRCLAVSSVSMPAVADPRRRNTSSMAYSSQRCADSFTTTTTIFICQNGRKPERATAHQSWLLTKETQIKHKDW